MKKKKMKLKGHRKPKRFFNFGRGKTKNMDIIEKGDTIVVNSAKSGVDKYFGMVGEVVNVADLPGFINNVYNVHFDAIRTTVRLFFEDELKLLRKKGSKVDVEQPKKEVEPVEAETPKSEVEMEGEEEKSKVQTIKLEPATFQLASKKFVCYVGPENLDEYVREQSLPKGKELKEKAIDLFFENEDLLPLLSVMKEFRLYIRNHGSKGERRLLWEIIIEEDMERIIPSKDEPTKVAETVESQTVEQSKSEPKSEEKSSEPFLNTI